MAQLVLAHPFPHLLLWGADLIQIYNDEYRLLMGARHPAGLGQPTRECWPEIWQRDARVYELVRTGESVTIEDVCFTDARTRGAEDAWFTVSYSPVFDDTVGVAGVLVTPLETTARKRAEEKLTASERRARAIVASLPAGAAFVIDRDLRYELADGEALAMAGFASDTFVGHTLSEVLEPTLAEAYTPHYLGALAGTPFEVEHTSHGRTFLTRGGPLRDGDVVTAALAVSIDITERKRAESALQASEERQVYLLALTDELSAIVDSAAIPAAACRLLCEHLDVGRVTYADIEGDQYVVRGSYSRGVLPMSGRGAVATSAHALCDDFRRVGVVTVDDFATDPRFSDEQRATYARVDIAAMASVAVVKADRWVASFAAHSAQPRSWSALELALVRETAERVWEAVERSRAEAALRESESRFRTLVENVPDYAIFGLDAAGTVTEWTAGAERVKGYTAEEVIGKHLALFFTPEAVAAGDVDRELKEAAATGRAEREGWRVRKGGERFWVNEVATAVRGEGGELRGYTKISRDLTVQKRIADERVDVLAREKEARREAERAMVLRDEFLTVISHELRTPLSSILLWSKMLQAGAVPTADKPRALASIASSASAQKKLIEDLLDVSSMLSGKLKLRIRDVSLGPVVEGVVAAVAPMAEIKGVRVDVGVNSAACWARVDPDRLRQVVWNLLNNAVKFTPRAGTVAIRLENWGPRIRITVEDTGQGIAPDFLPHVFERFRQQDASITRAQGGLGLGLAIARQLVELQGGSITATSEGQGLGSTFTIELPSCVPIDTSVVAGDDGQPGTVATYGLAGTRVLLVEDDPQTRRALQSLLESAGAQVMAAESAEEALKAVEALGGDESGRFDVLVSDIGLPGHDGYELLRMLRERATTATLPSLALTAYAREDDRQRAMRAGFDAYLAKPVEPRPLLEAVRALAQMAAQHPRGENRGR